MNINSVTTYSIIFVIYIVWSTKRKRKERNDTTAHCALGRAWSRCRVVVVVVSFFFCFFSLVSFLLLLFVFCWSFELLELERRKEQRQIKRIKRTKKDTTPLHTAHFGRTWSRCRVAVVIVSIFVLLYLVHSSFFSSLILNH